jgi:hypothetical protein
MTHIGSVLLIQIEPMKWLMFARHLYSSNNNFDLNNKLQRLHNKQELSAKA